MVTAYVFGQYRLDLVDRQLLHGTEVVSLATKALETLIALVQRKDSTVTKDELIKTVWHDSFVSEESLTQVIYVLRRALGDDSANPEFIATVARRGYRFVAPVTEVLSESAGVLPEAGAPLAASPASIEATRSAAIPTPAWRPSLAWIALALVAAVVSIAGTVAVLNRATAPALRYRFAEIAPLGATLISGGVVSPDSRYIAFVARDDASDTTQLWLKMLGSGDVHPLEGTEGAFRPFWSPDSQSLGFFASGRLRTVGVDGMPVRSIANVGLTPTGGTWGSNGQILYSDLASVVYGVPAAGGAAVAITTLDAGENAHRRPQFLPDGRRFLFFVASTNPERVGTYVGTVGSSDRIRLLGPEGDGALFAPPDRILFVRDGVLMAQPFDPDSLRLAGTPVLVAANVSVPSRVNSAIISASEGGILTFGGGNSVEHLAWFDRSGRRLSTVASPAKLHDPIVSADGQQLLAESALAETRGLWRIDLDRGATTRLMTDATMAALSPDGASLAYTANRTGAADLWIRSSADEGTDKPLVASSQNKYVSDWSSDGRFIVFVSNAGASLDLWLLERGEGEAKPLLQTAANEGQASLSPDGRWIAYASDESGAWEVYVQSFPSLGRKRTMSVGGGGLRVVAEPDHHLRADHARGDLRDGDHAHRDRDSSDQGPRVPLRPRGQRRANPGRHRKPAAGHDFRARAGPVRAPRRAPQNTVICARICRGRPQGRPLLFARLQPPPLAFSRSTKEL